MSEIIFDTLPRRQFEASSSAVRLDIVAESAGQKRRCSVGATSPEYAAPDGAKSKSTTATCKAAAPHGAGLPGNTTWSRDAIAKIEKGEPVTAPGVPKIYPDPKNS